MVSYGHFSYKLFFTIKFMRPLGREQNKKIKNREKQHTRLRTLKNWPWKNCSNVQEEHDK